MFELFFDFLAIGLILLALYFFIVIIVSIIFGISFRKALKKVQTFLSNTQKPLIEQDTTVYTKFYDKLKDLIGETPFKALERKFKLCIDIPPFGICTASPVPYYYFSCIYHDDESKDVLTLITEKIIVNHLRLYSYPALVYIIWDIHPEIKSPLIYAYFARNDDELKRLRMMISEKETDNTTLKE